MPFLKLFHSTQKSTDFHTSVMRTVHHVGMQRYFCKSLLLLASIQPVRKYTVEKLSQCGSNFFFFLILLKISTVSLHQDELQTSENLFPNLCIPIKILLSIYRLSPLQTLFQKFGCMQKLNISDDDNFHIPSSFFYLDQLSPKFLLISWYLFWLCLQSNELSKTN